MLPEYLEDIVNRVRNKADYTQADIETLITEVETLETAWRSAENQLFLDLQNRVRLKHLLRRLRYTSPPDDEAAYSERLAYARLLETIDNELLEPNPSPAAKASRRPEEQ